MTHLGYLHYFPSFQVLQTKEGIYLSQYKYACDLLHWFHMEYRKPTPSPFQFGVKIVATCITPNNRCHFVQSFRCYPFIFESYPSWYSIFVGIVALYMQTPYESHCKATKMILHHIQVQCLVLKLWKYWTWYYLCLNDFHRYVFY